MIAGIPHEERGRDSPLFFAFLVCKKLSAPKDVCVCLHVMTYALLLELLQSSTVRVLDGTDKCRRDIALHRYVLTGCWTGRIVVVPVLDGSRGSTWTPPS